MEFFLSPERSGSARRGRAGRNNGLNSRGERGREAARQGGRGRRERERERVEGKVGGEREEGGKGQGAAMSPTCVCMCACACALCFIFSWLLTVHRGAHPLPRPSASGGDSLVGPDWGLDSRQSREVNQHHPAIILQASLAQSATAQH